MVGSEDPIKAHCTLEDELDGESEQVEEVLEQEQVKEEDEAVEIVLEAVSEQDMTDLGLALALPTTVLEISGTDDEPIVTAEVLDATASSTSYPPTIDPLLLRNGALS